MRQVGYLQKLYRDARSTEHKIRLEEAERDGKLKQVKWIKWWSGFVHREIYWVGCSVYNNEIWSSWRQRLKFPPYLCSGWILHLQLQNHHKDMDGVFLRCLSNRFAGYTRTRHIRRQQSSRIFALRGLV